MDLRVNTDCHLPRLSWVAALGLADGVIRVTAGEWVEWQQDAVIEGAWDGPYENMGFDESACVFGSGIRVRGGCVTFVPSTSTTDALFWRQEQDVVRVANSLPLLLAASQDMLMVGPDYAAANLSILDGISTYQRDIPTLRGRVHRLLHHNLRVEGGRPSERDKVWPPPFDDYRAYRDYLGSRTSAILANARDRGRLRPMTVWSTQSRGYDSTAMNAVARHSGIDRVFTVAQGKAKGYFANEDRGLEADDDGTQICDVLGLPCTVIDRRGILRDGDREELYYAALHDVADFNLDEICSSVTQPTILLTGCLGELWYPRAFYDERAGLIDSELRRADLGNHGMSEVRLHAGYVQFAFPFVGARRRVEILELTESAAMSPWRLGTSYDRPIPRRIAEEAGVPREMFGQKKMASLLEYPPPLVPLGHELREQFFAFLRGSGCISRLGLLVVPIARRWNAMVSTMSPDRHRWLFYVHRILRRLPGRLGELPILYSRLGSTLYVFCVNRVAATYSRALVAADEGGQGAARSGAKAAPSLGAAA